MGKFNYRLADGKARLLEMDYIYSEAENPVYAAGGFRSGDFLLVNLLPLNDKYRLIIAPATMLEVSGKDNMERSVRGWFKPKLSVEEFLKAYSWYGGTNHLALTYGSSVRLVEAFGKIMGWETVVVE